MRKMKTLIHTLILITDEIENDEMENDEMENVDILESDCHFRENDTDVNLVIPEDKILNDEEFFNEILEIEAEKISNLSARNVKSTLKKVAKIPVAPGETGKFKNWGVPMTSEFWLQKTMVMPCVRSSYAMIPHTVFSFR